MFQDSIGKGGDFLRTIIVGNSGSGKSWVAVGMGNALSRAVTDLDEIHWLPGGYSSKRSRKEAIERAAKAANSDSWIIEGVYGWLVQPLIYRATFLIWLDLPWEDCNDNLRSRYIGKTDTQSFRDLESWARDYWERQSSSSFAGHKSIYESFERPKRRLTKRDEVSEFVRSL